ncbi:MAG: hypothetical protein AB7G17_12945 [Phycisphaerales bacterium]
MRPQGQGSGYRLVDPGFGDVDSLQNSLRQIDMRVDLRREVGWEKVYQGPDGKLWRYSGGLGASFPRSQYAFVPRVGVVTEIPAGTVFHIGASAPSAESMREMIDVGGPAPNRIDTRADAGMTGEGTAVERATGWIENVDVVPVEIADAKARAAGKTIADDDGYRRRRVAELVGKVKGN